MIKGEVMNTLKQILADIINAIKTRNFKNLNPLSKKFLVLSIIVIVLFFTILWLFSGENSKVNEEISQGYEQQLKDEKDENASEASEYTPPPLETNNSLKEQNGSNPLPQQPKQPANPFVIEDKDTKETIIPDLSGQNLSQQEQEEIINQIAKTQKPSDMIAFLKEIQSKFDFLKTQKRFKYDLKNYKVGDIFLWWEIEEITPVYIRFIDDDYAYNLRFLED